MMKRLWAAVCLLLWTTVAAPAGAEPALRGYDAKEGYQYVAFGEYPQDADGTERPIVWRVLSVHEGEAFLFSEYVLGNGCVHPDDKEFVAFGGEYNKTAMFAKLNGPFKEAAFSGQEIARLREDDALGAVFLVSSDELNDKVAGLGTNQTRMGYGTPYALANGLFQYQNGTSPYWMRTPSTVMKSGVRCIKVSGEIGYIRCVVENEGFRPAVRLILGDEPFAGGTGTLADPFYYESQKSQE